jgi:hypothetical protein
MAWNVYFQIISEAVYLTLSLTLTYIIPRSLSPKVPALGVSFTICAMPGIYFQQEKYSLFLIRTMHTRPKK